jgi:hypothetical protein
MAATLNLQAPPSLNLTAINVNKEFKDWIRSYEIYAIANEIDSKDEKVQCNIFLHVAGSDVQKLYSTWEFTDTQKDKIQPLKDKLKQHCEGKKNLTVLRYHFNMANQEPEEKFDQYHTRLKQLAQDCEFGALQEDLIKDRIICGIKEDKTRTRLLQTTGLTLDKCVEMCRLAEVNAWRCVDSQK